MRRLLAFAALVGAASCSSPFEPAELAGTYTASQIDGHALPFTYDFADLQRITLIADSIILRPDGTGRFGRTSEIIDLELDTSEIQRLTMEFGYTIDGRTLIVHQPDCNTVCDLSLWSIHYRIIGDKLISGALVLQKRAAAE